MREAGLKHVLFARHPETEANVALRYVGRGDTPYTSRGEGQAEALSRSIAEWRPQVVMCSPTRRALHPARNAALAAGVELVVDPGLVEYDAGDAEGLTWEEGVARGVIDPDAFGRGESPFRGGEPPLAYKERCRDARRRIEARPELRIAVVSHRGTLRRLILDILGLPEEATHTLPFEPAEAAVLAIGPDGAALESIGALPHKGVGGTMHSNL